MSRRIARPHGTSAALFATSVHDHLSEGISITDIAARVGVTPRTLQNGFRRAFNLTPAEYIRRAQASTHRCIRALLAADATAGVTNLMMNVGIVNFGRYAHVLLASKSGDFPVDDAKSCKAPMSTWIQRRRGAPCL